MRVGDVLDRSFELLRREWRAAVLLGGIQVVALVVIVGFYSVALFSWISELGPLEPGAVPDPDVFANSLFGVAGAVLGIVAFSLLVGLASIVLTGVLVRAAMHGPEDGCGWSELGRHVGPATVAGLRLLGWGLLFGIGISVLFAVPFIVLGAAGALDDDTAAALVVLVVLGGMGLFFLALTAVAPILSVMVGLVYGRSAGVWRSIGEGYRLVRRAYWPALGSTVVVWLFSLVPFLGSILVAVLTPPFQVALIERLEALDGGGPA